MNIYLIMKSTYRYITVHLFLSTLLPIAQIRIVFVFLLIAKVQNFLTFHLHGKVSLCELPPVYKSEGNFVRTSLDKFLVPLLQRGAIWVILYQFFSFRHLFMCFLTSILKINFNLVLQNGTQQNHGSCSANRLNMTGPIV